MVFMTAIAQPLNYVSTSLGHFNVVADLDTQGRSLFVKVGLQLQNLVLLIL